MGQRAAIYARVSTADQSCERQLRDLAGFAERGGYEVVEVFRETASGMKANRSARAEVMKLAQARHMALLQTWGTAARRHPVGGLGSIGEMLIEHNHGFGQGRGSNSECSFNQAHLPHDTWLQAPCLGLSFA